MKILILALGIYTIIGLLLVLRKFRGLSVQASVVEWSYLVFLWPLALPLYLQMEFMHRQMTALKKWGEELAND